MCRFLLALIVVVGCDPVVDKHTPDGHVDAAPDAPSHGMVSVKVFDPNNAGVVITGIPVVFVEADGTVVGRPVTDSNGVATADVHPNATATAVLTEPSSTVMTTLTGIQPGDAIIMNQSDAASMLDGTFTVTFPTTPNATSYQVFGPCGPATGTTSASISIFGYCKQATMDLFVVALDANSNPLSYIEKPGVPYTAGGSTAIAGTYQGLSNFTETYTNIDPAITSISMRRTVPRGIGFGRGTSGTPSSGALALQVTGILGQTAGVVTQAEKGESLNLAIQNIAGTALTQSMDVGATLLPWLGPVTLDVAAKKITVVADTTGTTTDQPDVFYVELRYSRPNGSAGTRNFVWTIYAQAPADITLPALPPEVGDVLPQEGDSVSSVLALSLETSMLTWDMLRPDVSDALGSVGFADTSDLQREVLYENQPE